MISSSWGIIEASRWVFFASVKASLVIALVFVIRFFIREHLPAKWYYALWLLVIFRLLLPIEIPTPVSIFNLTQENKNPYVNPIDFQEQNTELKYQEPRVNQQNRQNSRNLSAIPVEEITPQFDNTFLAAAFNSPEHSWSFFEIFSIFWIIGSSIWAIYAIYTNTRLQKKINSAHRLLDSRLVILLEKCKNKLNISRPVTLYSIDEVKTAFWQGLFKPRIYFPAHMVQKFTNRELEHIFLHELAHYRMNWIVFIMQNQNTSLYWKQKKILILK